MTIRLFFTAFEPFDNQNINSSNEVLKSLENNKNRILAKHAIQISTQLLPVDQAFISDWSSITDLSQFDYILLMGQSSRPDGINIEKIALNAMNFEIPDNKGIKAQHQRINPEAPIALESSLKLSDTFFELLQSQDYFAKTSYYAGTYLCNQIFFCILQKYHSQTKPIVTFLHIPQLPQQSKTKQASYLYSIDEHLLFFEALFQELK